MNDANEQRRLELRDKLIEELQGTKLNLKPTRRDVAVTSNAAGPIMSLAIWARYDLMEWPSHVLHQLALSAGTIFTVMTSVVMGCIAIVLQLLNIVAIPLVHLFAAMFGSLAVRYHPDTVREAYDRIIRSLPSYPEYVAAGGTFDAKQMPIPKEYLERINEEIAKREQQ